MTYSKSYYKHYFRKQRFLVLCQAQSGPHSFIDSLVLNLPSFLRSPSSLFSWSLKSLFPPTRLPPGYLPSAPSPLLQAVRILSVRGHTDPPLPTPPTVTLPGDSTISTEVAAEAAAAKALPQPSSRPEST